MIASTLPSRLTKPAQPSAEPFGTAASSIAAVGVRVDERDVVARDDLVQMRRASRRGGLRRAPPTPEQRAVRQRRR